MDSFEQDNLVPFGAPNVPNPLQFSAGWPEVDCWPIRACLPSVPVVPLSKLGHLGTWVAETAKGKAVSPDPILLNLLVIASGVVGAKRRVRVHENWTEPCILWGAHVAPPLKARAAPANRSKPR